MMNAKTLNMLSRRPRPSAARLGVFLVSAETATPRPLASSRCPRCGGSGEIPSFRHVENGVCFRCRGSGVDPNAMEALNEAEARRDVRKDAMFDADPNWEAGMKRAQARREAEAESAKDEEFVLRDLFNSARELGNPETA